MLIPKIVMAKEVRLNDKWWYGKHKDRSIREILDCDRMFLEDLVYKGKIKFHQNIQDYLNGNYRPEKKRYFVPDDDDQWWRPSSAPVVNDDPHGQQDYSSIEWEEPAQPITASTTVSELFELRNTTTVSL